MSTAASAKTPFGRRSPNFKGKMSGLDVFATADQREIVDWVVRWVDIFCEAGFTRAEAVRLAAAWISRPDL
jgi:hypothetical protein